MFELFKSHRPRDAKPAKAAQEVQAETQAKDSAEDRKPEELGGPQRSRAHPLRRLGTQGHLLRLLTALT